jgi:hypothetical protein
VLHLLALAAVALADAPPQQPGPASEAVPTDPATVAEAMRLLDEQGFEEQVLTSTQMSLEASMAGMTELIQKRLGEAVPEDFLGRLRQVMRDHTSETMRARLPALKARAARLYAQEFTRDELVRLTQLSADPVMVKARARDKILGPKLMMLGIETMRDAQPDLEARINRLIAEYAAEQEEKPTS